ncbi:MAG TPA: ATP-binding protein [Euzebyales bacterium]
MLSRVVAGVLLAACVAVVAFEPPSSDVLLSGLLWVPLFAAATMTRISLLPQLEVTATLSSIVIVAAALLLPASAVVLFALVGLLSREELNGRATLAMALFNRSQMALAGALVAWAVTPLVDDGAAWRLIVAAALGFVVFEVSNDLFIALMLTVRRGLSPRTALAGTVNPMPKFALNAAVSAPLSLLLAVLVRDVGFWSVVLLAAPLWLSHRAQQSAREAQDRAEELAVRVHELEMLNLLSTDLLRIRTHDTVEPTAEAVLRATGRHTVRVDRSGEATGATVVPIAGSEPAVIAVSESVDGPTRAGLEAAASLIGLTWSRLDLERELAETERARTALTGRILEEGTRERSRIAMSVHDDVLPLFAAAQMQIDNVGMLIEMGQLDRASVIIEKATTGVSDGICTLRDTLEDLRRSTLVPGTLADGLRKLIADLQARTGIRASVVAPSNLPDLPFAVELLTYETVRGCLANVEKHAEATKVQVEFQLDEGRLVVLMQDDGRGFDATRVGTRSHGLALMRQRAELARGSFDISGVHGAGTTVRLEVPTW